MSDVGTQEEKQTRLAGGLEVIYDRLKETAIFFCIGWFVIALSLGVLPYILLNAGLVQFLSLLVFLAGWAISAGPMIGRLWERGFMKMFEVPSYVVITTYADGRKESDGGAASAWAKLFMKLLGLALSVIIGSIATLLYSVYATIKYAVLYMQVKAKPVFLHTAYFLLVVTFAGLIGSIAVAAGLQKAGRAAQSAARGEKSTSGYRYVLTEAKDGVIIERYQGKIGGGDIVVPEEMDGLPVVQMRRVFDDCVELK